MVRRFVAGMTRMPFLVVVGLALVAVGVVLALRPRPAAASTYVNPWWTVTASVQEKACSNCGCEAPGAIVEPGVSVLTGELILDLPITSDPTMLGTMPLALRWRSMISGCTEFGNGVIPSWMTSVEGTQTPISGPV